MHLASELEDDELGEKHTDLEVLDRQIDLARTALAQTEVRAPGGGRILELLAHAGEVSSGPILQMGDLSAMVAIAEVDQSAIPRMRLGQAASVQVLDQTVSGKVTKIGVLVGKSPLPVLDPRSLQDRRTVKVTISLDNSGLAASLINMEVEVTIIEGGGSSSPTTGKPRAVEWG